MIKRNLKKAKEHLKQIPKGTNFFKYTSNEVSRAGKRITRSTSVAHPYSLVIEVTNQCNLHCTTCARQYHFGKEMDVGYMDIDLLKRIVDQAYPFIGFISLTGLGESLLYKHMPSALSYIKSKNRGIGTGIATNASLPTTERIIKEIRENLDTIQISIDGLGDVYNNIRRDGNYDLFLDNVRNIVAAAATTNTDVTFNMVVTQQNYHQIPDVIDLSNKIGVKCVNLAPFNVASTDDEVDYYAFYQSSEFKGSYSEAMNRAKQYPDFELIFWRSKRKGIGFHSCPYPWSGNYVTWNGYLVPCCFKPFPKELNFGNLNNKSLMECLNDNVFRDFRKMAFENKTPDFCAKCKYVFM